jgi:ATP-dependent Lhr-like helicase
MARGDEAALRSLVDRSTTTAALSADAESVRALLQQHGASFASDLRASTGLLPAQLEDALAELVSSGLASADGYAGLRALLSHNTQRAGIDSGGRWSLLGDTSSHDRERSIETLARKLLARYGVVFRKVLERESTEPWRELLRAYRRMEARGEVRGGRFVDGFTGEQFALPDAVSALRAIRKREPCNEWVSISAADPLNLVGIIVPGERVTATSSNRILLRDGLPVAVLEAKQVRFIATMEPAEQWQANLALRRKHMPTQPTTRM